MSRKHFEAVAAAIRTQLDNAVAPGQATVSQHTTGYCSGIEAAARAFAGVAVNDNPRFDTRRFLTACGINS